MFTTVCPKDNLYFYKLLTISIPDKDSHLCMFYKLHSCIVHMPQNICCILDVLIVWMVAQSPYPPVSKWADFKAIWNKEIGKFLKGAFKPKVAKDIQVRFSEVQGT